MEDVASSDSCLERRNRKKNLLFGHRKQNRKKALADTTEELGMVNLVNKLCNRNAKH